MNFSLLQENYPALQEYGHDAEMAMHQNLQVYFVKLRCFTEAFVSYVFDELTIVKQAGESLENRLSQADFVESVPKEIIDKLHVLQLYGERAIHGDRREGRSPGLSEGEGGFMGRSFLYWVTMVAVAAQD